MTNEDLNRYGSYIPESKEFKSSKERALDKIDKGTIICRMIRDLKNTGLHAKFDADVTFPGELNSRELRKRVHYLQGFLDIVLFLLRLE